MNVLIVDDTRLARNELRMLLESMDSIKWIGEASHPEEARRMIEEHRPDLLLLDIQMPGEDGFGLLESLDEVPQVIFVTAYDEFAIKAFEYNALDYLKKPVNGERLAQALDRMRVPEDRDGKVSETLSSDSRVFVKDGEKCWFVHLRDIRLFEVMDSYTRIYFQEFKPMIPKSLQYMESRLDPQVFFRANRQQIVNLKWVERIEPWFSGTIRLYLKDGTEVEVSRRQTSRFKELMSF